MDRKAYLKGLEVALLESYPEKQARDILADYENFFDDGIAEGKSEETLCREFGPPEQAVRELKGESSSVCTHSGSQTVNTICIVLGVTVLAFLGIISGLAKFFRIDTIYTAPNFLNFWLAMLLPLILEGILALRLFGGIPAKRGLNWVPRVQLVLFTVVAVLFAFLIRESFSIEPIAHDITSIGIYYDSFKATAIAWATWASIVLLAASGVLYILYAVHGHFKAHWLLFINTTLLTMFLNMGALLSHISYYYNALTGLASCFLWAALPNLAAAAILWIALKIHAKRRQKYGRPDEKRRSRNVHPA